MGFQASPSDPARLFGPPPYTGISVRDALDRRLAQTSAETARSTSRVPAFWRGREDGPPRTANNGRRLSVGGNVAYGSRPAGIFRQGRTSRTCARCLLRADCCRSPGAALRFRSFSRATAQSPPRSMPSPAASERPSALLPAIAAAAQVEREAARSSAGATARLRLSAQLMRPTWQVAPLLSWHGWPCAMRAERVGPNRSLTRLTCRSMARLRGPGESYSDVILRMVACPRSRRARSHQTTRRAACASCTRESYAGHHR
jgi:hypothetical protein